MLVLQLELLKNVVNELELNDDKFTLHVKQFPSITAHDRHVLEYKLSKYPELQMHLDPFKLLKSDVEQLVQDVELYVVEQDLQV